MFHLLCVFAVLRSVHQVAATCWVYHCVPVALIAPGRLVSVGMSHQPHTSCVQASRQPLAKYYIVLFNSPTIIQENILTVNDHSQSC